MKKLLFIFISFALLPQLSFAVSFDKQLKKIIPLCERLYLPNSMAKMPESNINTRQLKLEKKIEKLSQPFRSLDGVNYLNSQLNSEQDELAKTCIQHILESLPAYNTTHPSSGKAP